MKAYSVVFLLTAMIIGAAAHAQTTNFTLGQPDNNYVPVESQDGVATDGDPFNNYVYDCALKTLCQTYGQHLQQFIVITLPVDLIEGGQFYGNCTGVTTTNTIPIVSKLPQPGGVYQSAETCVTNFGDTWVGSITYVYSSVRKQRCSSGHAGGCVWVYVPVMIGGAGSLTYQP